MTTLRKAKETFEKAQTVALEQDNDATELMAIGMAELAEALRRELAAITSKVEEVERLVRRLD